jgi:hypothetical protein
MKELITKNPRICNFYEKNPTMNFETVNIYVIELLEKILMETNSNITDINSHILTHINENTNEIRNSIVSLKDTMYSISNDNKQTIISKISEIKKEYIDELRTIIQSNTHEKIGSLIEKNNSILIDKTALLLNEIIPKNQTQFVAYIQESLSQLYKSISDDTKTLLRTENYNSNKEYVNTFEMKLNIILQNLQQQICSFISASEERINTNIHNHSLKDLNQQKIINDIGNFIGNFSNDSLTNENQAVYNKNLSSVLTKMYNTAEITNNNSSSNKLSVQNNNNNSSSILLKRVRKPNIIIENKDSPENISIDDVNAFYSLTEEHNCNGIFISQHSGISTKKNYQIDIQNNNIIVFMHNVEYNSTKIQSAVDIIDNLSMKFRQMKTSNNPIENEILIPKDVLDNINTEYQLFITQRNSVIEVFKESQKKVLSQIDELRFPCLDKYLSTRYSAPVQKPGLKCTLCKSFTANNLKALAAHKRGCSRKNPVSNVLTNQSVDVK